MCGDNSGQMAKYLRNQGRFGDTKLAHVTPDEEALLRSLGGSGTINPGTGLKEFYEDDIGTVATTDYSVTGYDTDTTTTRGGGLESSKTSGNNTRANPDYWYNGVNYGSVQAARNARTAAESNSNDNNNEQKKALALAKAKENARTKAVNARNTAVNTMLDAIETAFTDQYDTDYYTGKNTAYLDQYNPTLATGATAQEGTFGYDYESALRGIYEGFREAGLFNTSAFDTQKAALDASKVTELTRLGTLAKAYEDRVKAAGTAAQGGVTGDLEKLYDTGTDTSAADAANQQTAVEGFTYDTGITTPEFTREDDPETDADESITAPTFFNTWRKLDPTGYQTTSTGSTGSTGGTTPATASGSSRMSSRTYGPSSSRIIG